MGEKKQGYWDVDRCAWVGAGERHDVRPVAAGGQPAAEAAESDPEVPEQRPADTSTLDVATPV